MEIAIGLIATAIGAIVTGVSQYSQNKSTEAAQNEARSLGEQQRQDVLKQQGFANTITEQGIAESKRQYNKTLGENQRQFNESTRRWEDDRFASVAKNLQAQADKSPAYAKELVSMWGA